MSEQESKVCGSVLILFFASDDNVRLSPDVDVSLGYPIAWFMIPGPGQR